MSSLSASRVDGHRDRRTSPLVALVASTPWEAGRPEKEKGRIKKRKKRAVLRE
jgi:hypothetical protein